MKTRSIYRLFIIWLFMLYPVSDSNGMETESIHKSNRQIVHYFNGYSIVSGNRSYKPVHMHDIYSRMQTPDSTDKNRIDLTGMAPSENEPPENRFTGAMYMHLLNIEATSPSGRKQKSKKHKNGLFGDPFDEENDEELDVFEEFQEDSESEGGWLIDGVQERESERGKRNADGANKSDSLFLIQTDNLNDRLFSESQRRSLWLPDSRTFQNTLKSKQSSRTLYLHGNLMPESNTRKPQLTPFLERKPRFSGAGINLPGLNMDRSYKTPDLFRIPEPRYDSKNTLPSFSGWEIEQPRRSLLEELNEQPNTRTRTLRNKDLILEDPFKNY